MAAAARKLGLHHEPLNLHADERVRGPWHIQNVNAHHSRLKSWIARLDRTKQLEQLIDQLERIKGQH